MEYVGLQTQIWRNNTKSTALLMGFPLLLFGLLFLFFAIIDSPSSFENFLATFPIVFVLVLFWFMIAFFFNTWMIRKATGAKTLDRKENKRVYNLVENLCISTGMQMPKVNILEDDSLNAFASGINQRTYTVTLSRGIINALDDDELEGVIAHELTHIRNRDVRLLIVSIIFVGIFATIAQVIFRVMIYGGGRRSKGRGAVFVMLIAVVLAFIGYGISVLFKFAISRKREYMADAGGAQMTQKPLALASALEKVSRNSRIDRVKNTEVAQLFIDYPMEKKKGFMSGFSGLFATHPPIEKRIELLKQF